MLPYTEALLTRWWQRWLCAFALGMGVAAAYECWGGDWTWGGLVGSALVVSVVGFLPVRSLLRLGIVVGAFQGITTPGLNGPYWLMKWLQVTSGIGAAVLLSLVAEAVVVSVRAFVRQVRAHRAPRPYQ
jgi:hypothetical protein